MIGPVYRLFLRFRSVDKLARGPVTSAPPRAQRAFGSRSRSIPQGASSQAHLTDFGPLKEFFQ